MVVTYFVTKYIETNGVNLCKQNIDMTNLKHILIVDDHKEIRELVTSLLTKAGYRVSSASDGRHMGRILRNSRIDLVVLDLMLPGEDGLTLCRNLRATTDIPIVMLTAKGDEFDRVLGLEMGADDYLAKPFSGRELAARIKAVLRRSQALPYGSGGARDRTWKFDQWTFDAGTRNLKSDENIIVPLSTSEYKLLLAFVERPNIVLTRDQLLDLTRGRDAENVDRSIDTRISRLRRKLEKDPQNPRIINTVWGGGYAFVAELKPR